MTQTWTDDVFASSHNAQTDLQNMENNFQTLKSLFEGTSAPANTVAGMPWFDSGKDLLRLRNAANGSWYGLMHADASQQIWVYRNDAMSGWVINSNVADKVLAIKGGSRSYDVTGGTTAGSWTISGFVDNGHSHSVDNHSHGIGSDGNHNHGIAGAGDSIEDGTGYQSYTNSDGSHNHGGSTDTTSPGTSSDTTGISHDGTHRPAAAVGTLQRMDV